MGLYGKTETWKITYSLPVYDGGRQGVALMEAESRQEAMYAFQREYEGQFGVIRTCEKLLG